MKSKGVMEDIKNFIDEANIVNVVMVTKETPRKRAEFKIISMLEEVQESFKKHAKKFIEAKSKLAVKFINYKPWHKLEDYEYAFWKIEKNPSLFNVINRISKSNIADLSQFSYDEKILRKIAYYVIVVEDARGNRVLLYGKFGNANILDRRGKFSIIFGRNTFQQLRKGLTFSEMIDCIVWKGELLIFNQRNFETIFDYYDSLKKVADKIVDKIEGKLNVKNIDKLREIAKSNKRMLIKMAEMKENKSIENLDTTKMDKFFKNNEELKRDFEYKKPKKGKKPQITFDPSMKKRWKFIRLLNEDYYGSGTTNNKYIATSKQIIP